MNLRALARFYYEIPRRFTAGLMPPVRNATIELTYRCNLRCEQCFIFNEEGEFGLDHKGRADLTTEEVLSLVRQFPPGSNIQLTGGEVFVRKDIEVLLEAMLARHKVSIATNGMLLQESIVQKLIDWRLRTLSMSVDGPEEVHDEIRRKAGSFRDLTATMRGVLACREKAGRPAPYTNFNCVILEKNFRRLHEVVEHAAAVGVDSCSFQIMDGSMSRTSLRLFDEVKTGEPTMNFVPRLPRAGLEESLRRAFEIGLESGVTIRFNPKDLTLGDVLDYYEGGFDLSAWKCDLPWSTTRISPYGDVFPCMNYRIGNVKERSLLRLWNNGAYRRFRKYFENGVVPSCAGCCKMVKKVPPPEGEIPHGSGLEEAAGAAAPGVTIPS
ncbi:MAG: radical SAM protein [bacterium]